MADKVTKITDTYLKDFAQKQLDGFIEVLTTDPSIRQLTEFANGLPSGASPGGDPSGGYNQVLTGNTGTPLSSSVTLQSAVKNLASMTHEQVNSLVVNSKTLKQDLLQIDDALTDADDKANITASELGGAFQNLNLASGDSSTANTTTTPPNSSTTPPNSSTTPPNTTTTPPHSGTGSGTGSSSK